MVKNTKTFKGIWYSNTGFMPNAILEKMVLLKSQTDNYTCWCEQITVSNSNSHWRRARLNCCPGISVGVAGSGAVVQSPLWCWRNWPRWHHPCLRLWTESLHCEPGRRNFKDVAIFQTRRVGWKAAFFGGGWIMGNVGLQSKQPNTSASLTVFLTTLLMSNLCLCLWGCSSCQDVTNTVSPGSSRAESSLNSSTIGWERPGLLSVSKTWNRSCTTTTTTDVLLLHVSWKWEHLLLETGGYN